jgi:cytoskeletal protein RodZ
MSLEALERNDLSRLPGGIFTRSFIRAYAQEVGLDPDQTIQDFLAELSPDAATATAHHAVVEDGEQLEADRKALFTAIRLVLVSIPIVVLVIYLSTHQRPIVRTATALAPGLDASSAPPNVASGPAEGDLPPVAVPDADSRVAPAVMSEAASGLTMEISPKSTCWVSVTVDGDPTFSGLMNAGERRQISAREEVLVTVGDAGAFAYALNGRPGKPLGEPGEVVSRRINLSNYKDLVTP